MFSSTTNAYLLPRLSPPPPPPFLGGDATDFFLQYHSDLLLTDTLFGMVVSNKPPVRNQEASTELNGKSFGPKRVLPKMKKAAKKHKHSKIFTAQGLRDRRVRLSIETARKFFDLQDMLGFEKASKTIDWLLRNSKAEIKDLLNKAKDGSSGGVKSTLTSTASGCEVVSAGAYEGTKMKELEISTVGKGKKVQLQKDRAAAFDERYLASRESRARARERARERTREKKILRSKLKGSPISSDEQKISQDSFKFVPSFGRPATSTVNGNIV